MFGQPQGDQYGGRASNLTDKRLDIWVLARRVHSLGLGSVIGAKEEEKVEDSAVRAGVSMNSRGAAFVSGGRSRATHTTARTSTSTSAGVLLGAKTRLSTSQRRALLLATRLHHLASDFIGQSKAKQTDD